MSPAAPRHRSAADLAPALDRVADTLAWPLMVLDDTGRLRRANRAARALLALGDPLQREPGQPVRPRAEASRAAYARALKAAAAGTSTRLHWATAQGLCAAMLHPLAGATGASPRCLLVLIPAGALRPDLAAYAHALGLSPPQTRVLHLLAQDARAAVVATALGVAATTAGRHIAALRRMSGHPTVAGLVQSLGRLPPALPGVAAAPKQGE